jgi:hypothetical protein
LYVQSNPTNEYGSLKIRPLLSSSTNHAMIEVMIKISNGATGLTISKTSKLLLTNLEVDKFKAQENFTFEFENVEIKNVIEKKVNKIVQESTTPKILHIQKKIYVEVQSSININASNADKYILVQTSQEITSTKLYLRIGPLTIENEPNNKLMFKLPQAVYHLVDTGYVLLDDDLLVIQQGSIIRN